ncbi:MAG: hypothetical protein OHK0039_41440 [Bacteroidia bacterium]
MANSNPNVNRLDEYLARIEARERSKNRRKTLLLAGAIVLVLGLAGAYRLLIYQPDMQIVSLTDLDEAKLNQMLSEDPRGLLVYNPEFGTDTVQSIEDYHKLLGLLEMVRAMRENTTASEAVQLVADTLAEETTVGELKAFTLNVSGNRTAGQTLTFQVEGFDPNISYLIDFGNGYRRRMNRNTTYSYPQAGFYKVSLLASGSAGSSVYTHEVQIAAGVSPNPIASNAPQADEDQNTNPSSTNTLTGDSSPLVASRSFVPNRLEPIINSIEPEQNIDTRRLGADFNNNTSTQEVAQPTAPVENNAGPMVAADLMPEFPGGTQGMARFIRRYYRYPTAAQNAGVEGDVLIRFVVAPDGSLREPVVVKGIGYGCDEEALRLVGLMPRWIPGEVGGRTVPVYKTIVISFRLL